MGNEIEKLKSLKLDGVERIQIIKGRESLKLLLKTECSNFNQILDRNGYGIFYWVHGFDVGRDETCPICGRLGRDKCISLTDEILEILKDKVSRVKPEMMHFFEKEFKRESSPLLLTEDERNWLKQVLSSDYVPEPLTEDELNWLKQVLSGFHSDYKFRKIELYLLKQHLDEEQLSPGYVRLKKTEFERNQNKGNVRKELDALRKNIIQFTPNDLLELRNKRKREWCGFENFAGIYIIHNRIRDIYYVGQAERVFERAYHHFLEDRGNPEIYTDYCSGDEFSVSLIPLEDTSFTSLKELEDYAIRAYDSFPNGYNRMPGNYMEQRYSANDDYQKVAEFLLDKLKGTELHISLSNTRKRYNFIGHLCADLGLLRDERLARNFDMLMKLHKKANKKNKE
jgi:hypothetical protein